MISENDWSKFKQDKLEHVLNRLALPLSIIETTLMDDIEICSVNTLFQRYRDFLSEIDKVKETHLNN